MRHTHFYFVLHPSATNLCDITKYGCFHWIFFSSESFRMHLIVVFLALIFQMDNSICLIQFLCRKKMRRKKIFSSQRCYHSESHLSGNISFGHIMCAPFCSVQFIHHSKKDIFFSKKRTCDTWINKHRFHSTFVNVSFKVKVNWHNDYAQRWQW